MTRKILLVILVIASLGCSSKPPTSPPASPPTSTNDQAPPANPPAPEPDLNPVSPNVVYADGWNEIVIVANSAKTRVGVGAHLTTNRNKCGRDAYSSIELAEWNDIAKNTNAAMKTTRLPD